MNNQSLSSIPPTLFTTRQQPYSTRISNIQKQLNILCCQHDSLMPLLDITSYESLLYRWEQNLRTIHKKINQYEAKVNQIINKDQRIEQQTINSQNHKILSFNKINTNIQQIKSKLITISNNGIHDQHNYTNQNKSVSPLQHFKIQNQQALQEIKRYTQTSLALFKNQILLQQLYQTNRIQNSRSLTQLSNGQQQIVEKFKQSMFHQLRKQVESLRNGLEGRQGDEQFYQFTIDRIGCDLIEINEVLEILLQNNIQNQRKNEQNPDNMQKMKEQMQFITQKVKLINWQIKGIKKKYLLIINQRLDNQAEAFQAKSFQKIIVKDINTLQNAYRQVNAKIQYLNKNTKF